MLGCRETKLPVVVKRFVADVLKTWPNAKVVALFSVNEEQITQNTRNDITYRVHFGENDLHYWLQALLNKGYEERENRFCHSHYWR